MSHPPRPSCAIILARRKGNSYQVYLVQRSAQQRFFPDFYAFPGGSLEASDQSIEIPSLEGELLWESVALVREVFEETGIFLAQPFPVRHKDLSSLRKNLWEKKLSFAQIIQELNLHLDSKLFTPLGRKTTPPYSALRYQTRFFWAEIPGDLEPEIWKGELENGFWFYPKEALEKWERRELLIAPPVLALLRLMAEGSFYQDGKIHLDRLKFMDDEVLEKKGFSIPFDPSCEVLPLRAGTVPPATHTNCYFLGKNRFYILDPGPVEEEEQKKLLHVIDEKIEKGQKPLSILISHYHPDHIGAVHLLRDRYKLQVWAHPRLLSFLQEKGQSIPVDKTLEDGEILSEGDRGDIHVLHTPGHSMDHLSFFFPQGKILICADMISTLSSMIVPPPPKGDLKAYMASLSRLLALEPAWLFPSHGPPTPQAVKKIESYIRHRESREEQLIQTIGAGKETLAEIVASIYMGEIKPEMIKYAEYNVQSGLYKLVEEGRVAQMDERYVLVSRENKS